MHEVIIINDYIWIFTLSDLPPNPRMRMNDERTVLTFSNVSSKDIQVIQCNASNVHGYILANAYLNVFGEPSDNVNKRNKLSSSRAIFMDSEALIHLCSAYSKGR